jgi:parallel beta-helix repeat protein
MRTLLKNLGLIRIFSLIIVWTLIFIEFFGLLIFTEKPVLAADYNSPNTGVTWIMDDLVNNSSGVVTGGSGIYYVHDNITIFPSDRLIIKPGEVIKFDGYCRLRINGSLIANGTKTQPITFTSNRSNPIPGDWIGLEFYQCGKVESNYWNISYAYIGMFLRSSAFNIKNSIISNSSDSGISLKWWSANAKIYNCKIFNNTYAGIYAVFPSILVINNTIFNNGWGINIGRAFDPKVENNRVFNNKYSGIYIWHHRHEPGYSSYPVVRYNHVYGNGLDGIAFSTCEITLSNNYIHNNQDKGIYGGYKFLFDRSGNIDNNVILNNSGWGIYLKKYSANMNNNLIKNSTIGVGGEEGSSASLRNCIIDDVEIGVNISGCGGYYYDCFINSSSLNFNLSSKSRCYAINSNFNHSMVMINDELSYLTISYYFKVLVVDEFDKPVNGVKIEPRNATNEVNNYWITWNNGWVNSTLQNQTIYYNWTRYHDPYNLTASKAGLNTTFYDPMPVMNKSRTIKIIMRDRVNPITSALVGEPKFRADVNDSWNITSETEIGLTVTEEASLINYTAYKIDNSSWIEYLDNFNLTMLSNGPHFIYFNSTDSLKNKEITKSILVVKDDLPPITAINIGFGKYRTNSKDNWNVTLNTTFSLTPMDSYSGVNSTNYKIDDGNWTNYNGTFNLSLVGKGVHIISFNSIDNLNNSESINSITVFIDEIPPITTITVGNPKTGNDPTYVTTSTRFTLNHNSDSFGAGVAFSWYTLNSGMPQMYTGSFTVPLGTSIIEYGSVDNLGNNETAKTINVFVDVTSPLTTLDIGFPQMGSDPILISPYTEITLTHDNDQNEAGVAFTWYKFNDSEPQFYTGPFTIPVTITSIEWGSEDTLGNNETGNIINIYIDNVPPKSKIIIGTPKYGSYPKYVTSSTFFEFIHDNDNNKSGVKSIKYKLNSGASKIYSVPFNVSEEITSIKWWSEDIFNNIESVNSIDVSVDNTPPETEISFDKSSFGSDPVNITTSTLITINDNNDFGGVGVNSIWYQFNSDEKKKYTDPFNALIGTNVINWWSEDLLGNIEKIKSINVYVDFSPPVTSIEIGEPKFGSEPILVTSNSKFTLIPTETDNKIEYTYYRIDDGEWLVYLSPFIVKSDGEHTIYYYSVDVYDKAENIKSLDIFVDNTPPGKPILDSNRKLTNNKDINITGSSEPYCEIKILIDNKLVGINTSNDLGVFSTAILIFEGENVITAKAVDIFGRVSVLSEPQTVVLDTQKPEAIDLTPINYEMDMSLDTSISATFNEQMAQVTVEDAFSISPFDDGEFIWNDNTFEFIPKSDLSYNTTYTITISRKATDLAGNHLAEIYSWSFITLKLDSDKDGYPNDIDAFPHNPLEWRDSDGDNVGDNRDYYPKDPTKWIKESEPPEPPTEPKPVKKKEQDLTMVILVIAISVIGLIIFIFVLFLLIRPKKPRKGKEIVTEQEKTEPQKMLNQIQQTHQQPQISQYPPQEVKHQINQEHSHLQQSQQQVPAQQQIGGNLFQYQHSQYHQNQNQK